MGRSSLAFPVFEHMSLAGLNAQKSFPGTVAPQHFHSVDGRVASEAEMQQGFVVGKVAGGGLQNCSVGSCRRDEEDFRPQGITSPQRRFNEAELNPLSPVWCCVLQDQEGTGDGSQEQVHAAVLIPIGDREASPNQCGAAQCRIGLAEILEAGSALIREQLCPLCVGVPPG